MELPFGSKEPRFIMNREVFKIEYGKKTQYREEDCFPINNYTLFGP